MGKCKLPLLLLLPSLSTHGAQGFGSPPWQQHASGLCPLQPHWQEDARYAAELHPAHCMVLPFFLCTHTRLLPAILCTSRAVCVEAESSDGAELAIDWPFALAAHRECHPRPCSMHLHEHQRAKSGHMC
jgi:hypothetical protein